MKVENGDYRLQVRIAAAVKEPMSPLGRISLESKWERLNGNKCARRMLIWSFAFFDRKGRIKERKKVFPRKKGNIQSRARVDKRPCSQTTAVCPISHIFSSPMMP